MATEGNVVAIRRTKVTRVRFFRLASGLLLVLVGARVLWQRQVPSQKAVEKAERAQGDVQNTTGQFESLEGSQPRRDLS